MRKSTSFPILVLLLLVFAGCETVIPVELPPHTPQLTINSTFTNDSLWYVHLSESIGIGESDGPEPIEDGEVRIYADGVILDTLFPLNDGYYVSLTQMPQLGVAYEVQASAPGFETVKANSILREAVPILSTSARDLTNSAIDFASEIKFSFQDPPGNDYYFVAIYRNNSGVGNRYPLFIESQDPTLGASPLNADWSYQGLLFTDASFNGQLKEIAINSYEFIESSQATYLLFLASLSEDYYRYALTSSAANENEGNPFAEPVRIHSNVEGGYGIFAGYSIDWVEL